MESETKVRVVLEVNGKQIVAGITDQHTAESLGKIVEKLLETKEDPDSFWLNWERNWQNLAPCRPNRPLGW